MKVFRRRVGEWWISCSNFLLTIVALTSSRGGRWERIDSRSSVVAKTLAAGVVGVVAGERISTSASVKNWKTQLRIKQLAGGFLLVTSLW
jgi:hypothetical protein